ncbi:MAG: hypothetical protein JO250_03200 [Armatimonadetes bacterium]|nr:hypothetical protein [Armatimonadota bacterium]
MDAVYAVCLVAFLIHAIALPAFLWALKRRQITGSDQEAFRAVQGESAASPRPRRDPAETASARPVSRLKMTVFFGFLITLFVLLLCSLVFIVVVSAHLPGAAAAS